MMTSFFASVNETLSTTANTTSTGGTPPTTEDAGALPVQIIAGLILIPGMMYLIYSTLHENCGCTLSCWKEAIIGAEKDGSVDKDLESGGRYGAVLSSMQ